EEAELIADDLDSFAVIALNFPVFSDGRNYSNARLLRDRYQYQGELRSIGDVLRDQLFFMRRCGFNAYALREDHDPHPALASLQDFSEVYQSATDQPLPLFRRRCAWTAPDRGPVPLLPRPTMVIFLRCSGCTAG